MTSILIVDKTGTIKSTTVKNLVEADLYKKAGLKTNEGFAKHTTWGVTLGERTFSVSLYGKITGKANTENKYEFPPPVDTVLFFGSCVLVNADESGAFVSLSTQEWIAIYENLYGGFDDCSDEDEEDEDDTDDDAPRTKDGYVKDGFVVDDVDESSEEDEESEEEDDDDDDDDDDGAAKKKRKPVKKAVKKVAAPKQVKTVFDLKPAEVEENYLDCTSELVEEEYV
jgi:hypothetical protein